MIENRPHHLLSDPSYCILPPLPIGVDFASLPPLLGRSLDELGGIQPVNRQMSEAAGGPLYDKPSDGEIALHRQNGTSFQMISVIVSVFYADRREQTHIVRPFAISLLPASKRGKVDARGIDAIAQLDVDVWLKNEPCYKGFDPFKGTYGLYGTLGMLLDKDPKPGFIDEIGLVVRQYFLATTYDEGEILISPAGLSHPGAEKRYQRHRKRLFFSPFHKVETRQVWGAESPIELFLIQELARRGLFPQIQMLILDDGETFPSLYHLWSDIEFRHRYNLITEADFFFPDQRVAVFCDSNKYHRSKKRRDNDDAISEKLRGLGIKSVRLNGGMIVDDLKAAADVVAEAL